MKIEIPKALLPLLTKLNQLRGFLITLAALAIIGYTGYQISMATSVTPTQASINAAKEKLNPTEVKFDMATINSITHHTTVRVAPDLGGIGTTNPFYGQ